ncbi:DUF5335 family protein [Phenylobacterium sp.]|jgi:hypothetical protein|uniref:DUF5335 family protein n=1 Tax=Phenylobacterium sp. TaxID=1871053 RepID=UPI002E2F34E7|nr:DUF5335 family protein [Phenylobacterium sp.]HEX4709634.1 DUF5335 family protein [Phenylobacterium sp.]
MPNVDKSKWQAAADLLSRAIHGQPARLEVASLRLGDQVEAEWAPLLGVTYDPKDNLFEIRLQGLDHLITDPRLFAIREREGLADSLAVTDGEGIEHLLLLRQPIALPPTPAA